MNGLEREWVGEWAGSKPLMAVVAVNLQERMSEWVAPSEVFVNSP